MPAQKINQSSLKTESSKESRVQVVRPEPLKILLEWKAPIRPFKKRDREYFTTIGAMVFLLAVILLFLKEWLLITVIVALAFYAYIMATVEPQEVDHKISNRGITTGGRSYAWNELGRFWFSEKWGQKILNIESPFHFPQRLTLLLGEVNQEKIKQILSERLLYEQPEKTWVDNASDWLSRRVPLES